MSRQTEPARADAATVQQVAGGRMAAGERRLQIAQVAMRLFSERGFRGTTTKEIAQAAGVSEAIIFRHFATKDDLYTAIIDLKSCAGFGAGASTGGQGHPLIETIRGYVGEGVGGRDDPAIFLPLALALMGQHQSDPPLFTLL